MIAYEFDRYISGYLMAEGVRIEKAKSLEDAMIAAARIASRGPSGEVPVLVLRAPAPDQLLVGATNAERLEDLRLAASAIRTYMPDTLPAGEDGKIHFARALAEAAAESIEVFLAASEADHG